MASRRQEILPLLSPMNFKPNDCLLLAYFRVSLSDSTLQNKIFSAN